MAQYLEVDEGRGRAGLRLAITAGYPGPWGEAAKGIFRLKGIPFVLVRQSAGLPNDSLRDWTGQRNAPVAVFEDERPRSHWADILALAERLAPEPRLVPRDAEERVRMFGLANELCGEEGFGWQRRLALLEDMRKGAEAPGAPAPYREIFRNLAARYGFAPEAAARAGARVAEILVQLSAQLRSQRERGRRFLVGEHLTALDVYWATFAVLIDPLPDEQCPMAPDLRASYTARDPELRALAKPLLEHRDQIYRDHLGLPLDF
jgi:glutathione S-transferase